jgi:transcriptional regulator with XRE-family HTH domain
MKISDLFDGWCVISVDRLNLARERLGKEYQSFVVMSKILDINESQLCNYFKGKTMPNLKNLKKLCLYLQVPADYLMGLKIEEGEQDE